MLLMQMSSNDFWEERSADPVGAVKNAEGTWRVAK